MTIHAGCCYQDGDVSIGAPDVSVIRILPRAPDVAATTLRWLEQALQGTDVYYFVICLGSQPVGDILLHDISASDGVALVAYHLFSEQHRGQGIGTTALALLQQHVVAATALRRLVIITSDDNPASQRIAQKCGFIYTGRPHEDPEHGLVFEWEAPAAVGRQAPTRLDEWVGTCLLKQGP